MAGSYVPMSNINALFGNTEPETTADGPLFDPAITDIVNTVNGNKDAVDGLISAGTLSRLGVINVTDYGASGSANTYTGTIAAGSQTLTLTTSHDFVQGQGIAVPGAGAAGATLVTAVSSVQGSSGNITLSDAASTTATGVTVKHDDTVAIQAAIDAADAEGDFANSIVVLPVGFYRTTDKIVFSKRVSVEAYGAVILPDNSVLTAVEIGKAITPYPYRINIHGLRVERSAYDGATENVGFKFLECNQSTFIDLESRYSKYNYVFSPTVSGFSYNSFINPQGIGGYYNFHFNASGTGYANQNTFTGGRGFCTTDTNTNLYLNHSADHNCFYAFSLEGLGVRGVFDDGTFNYHSEPRLEGTWSSGYGFVFGANSQGVELISNRYDTIYQDNGVRNRTDTFVQGLKRTTNQNNRTTTNFRREGANVTLPGPKKTITGITKANPAVVTSSSHGLSNNNIVRIVGVSGMTEINNHYYQVANVTTNTFELKDLDGHNINSSSFTTYTSGGGAIPGVPVNLVQDLYDQSGYSNVNDWYVGRVDDDSSAFRVIRLFDGLIRASLTGSGIMTVAQRFKNEQSSWAFSPLVLGSYTIWIDSGGKPRIKNGTPSSSTDGSILQVALSGTTAARPTTDISTGQLYFDTTLGKPVWRNGSNWCDATGATV